MTARRTGIWTWMLSMIVLLSGMGLVVDTASADSPEEDGMDFPSLNVTKERISGLLGGGEFIGIHNPDNDAMIGVLYGTEENPNNVYIVSVFTRYLGVADIYGENGVELASDRPIPVRTLYAQRFETLYEFADMNDDGVWDSRRVEGQQYGQHQSPDEENMTMEPVFKKVPLKTSWEPSEMVKKDHGNGSVEWSLVLAAKDLAYRAPILGSTLRRVGTLETVQLTFHLYVQRRNVTRDDIPSYRVEVKRGVLGGYTIGDTERTEYRSHNGTALSAKVKYDHSIVGWDFSARNPSPHLLLSTEVLFLNGASPRVSQFLRYMREDDFEGNGTIDYTTPSGEQWIRERNALEGSGEDPVVSQSSVRPSLVQKNRLGIADNWQRVGQLRWVSNVTVDGEEDNMFFQIYFARAFRGVNANGAMFSGMGVVGGFSYPGGSNIYHDPTFEASSFQVIADKDGSHPVLRTIIIVGLTIFVVVAVLVLVSVVGLIVVKRNDRLMTVKKWKEEEEDDTYYLDR